MSCYKLSHNWTVSRTLIISWFISVTTEQVKRTMTVNEISDIVLVKSILIIPWITLWLWSCDALFHSALLLTLWIIIYWLQVTDESELQKVNVKSGTTQWLSGLRLRSGTTPCSPKTVHALCLSPVLSPPYQNTSSKSIHSELWFWCLITCSPYKWMPASVVSSANQIIRNFSEII